MCLHFLVDRNILFWLRAWRYDKKINLNHKQWYVLSYNQCTKDTCEHRHTNTAMKKPFVVLIADITRDAKIAVVHILIHDKSAIRT